MPKRSGRALGSFSSEASQAPLSGFVHSSVEATSGMALSPPEGQSILGALIDLRDPSEDSKELVVDDIVEIAGERLRATGYPELRRIDCSCCRGLLILRGRVTSYFQKQLAQETLRNLPGKRSILNEVEVVLDPSAFS
jgi:hypothetical protein